MGPSELSAEERTLNAQLVEIIRGEITQSSGVIPFSRFMEIALYQPGCGYYVSGTRKFGEGGDFVTAPELGELFAGCLARQVTEILDAIGGGEVLELGGGSGKLAADLIDAFGQMGRPAPKYRILEISPELQHRQRDRLALRCPHHLPQVEWLTALPTDFHGVILANEVVDALPVERFHMHESIVEGLGVGWKDGEFVDRAFAAESADWAPVRELAQNLSLAEGYQSEYAVQAQAWMASMAECLSSGVLIVVDYGYPEREYYHPQRSQGTLMCHYRHRAHSDPYSHVGLQDITAHVNFSALANRAHESGLSVLGYTNQASFLLSLGILDIMESRCTGDAVDTMKLSQEVKKLTLPSEMGEMFKVLAVGLGVDAGLSGFAMADSRHRL